MSKRAAKEKLGNIFRKPDEILLKMILGNTSQSGFLEIKDKQMRDDLVPFTMYCICFQMPSNEG